MRRLKYVFALILLGIAVSFLMTPREDKNRALISAIKAQDFDKVSKLIEKGADINYSGGSPLLAAIYSRSNNSLKLIIDSNPHMDLQLMNKAILNAARTRNVGFIGELLKKYPAYREEVLATAINKKREKVLFFLLEVSPELQEIVKTSPRFLKKAIEVACSDCVARLLISGASALPLTDGAWSPIVEAMNRRDAKIVASLIFKGADVNTEAIDGMTPMKFALLTEDLRLVAHLIGKGVNVNTRTKEGLTPARLAVMKDSVDDVKLFMENGASESVNDLYIAALRQGSTKVIEYLLSVGGSFLSKDENGVTPLMVAAEMGNMSLVSALIDKGAKLNERDNNGKTVLSYCMEGKNQDEEIFLSLVRAGAER